MNGAYIALGSNLGNRENNLQKAILCLQEKAGRILKASSIYETQPWQMKGTAYFLNQVVLLETAFCASQLMNAVLQIEESLGRVRTHKKGYASRNIDIDILFFNNETIITPSLIIPHPQIAARRFVLEPMAEIAPAYIHPQLKKTVGELLASCTDTHSVAKPVLK